MKLVIQRVQEASVTIQNQPVAKIGPGLLILLGIHADDTKESIDYLIQKMIHLRIFEDEAGKMNRSLLDTKGSLLIVSQFTLYGNCDKGRRPSFIEAARPEKAIPLYAQFIIACKKEIADVQTGEFGADMQVSLINDGPVTVILEK